MNRVRRFIERGRKGYYSEDLWSFDNFLSDLLVRGLTEFKKHCHGYPNDLDDWDKWMLILDEMIECFREQGRGVGNLPSGKDFILSYNRRMENKKQKLHRGLELLEKYYYDLWD